MATHDYMLNLHDPSPLDSFVQDLNEIFLEANIDEVTLIRDMIPHQEIRPCYLMIQISQHRQKLLSIIINRL